MRLPTLPTSGLCSAGSSGMLRSKQHEVGLSAEEAYPDRFEGGEIGGGGDGRHPFGVDGPQIGTRYLREDRIVSAYGSSFQADNPNGRPPDLLPA